ncbi:hypothetical protein GCM10007301_00580 [Azorhizobium oxalatiphilum]|uniref:VPEID-CTERM protein sorting domain-containing protein n=1 Tax=Azorhizobium oxalatiphilum TaxID=980631 RepID=A0A917BGZ6_9HYPH|nr:hypothetical protein [Azorhizobium oxalatiphilum]GGF44970.1 hypothetical protein GCM10007301_00580 [Azorhizobium oxalatiphilum]
MHLARLVLMTAVLGLSSVSMANALSIDLGIIDINIGGGGSNGAPAPVAAAGLPLLAALGLYKAVQWRRRR